MPCAAHKRDSYFFWLRICEKAGGEDGVGSVTECRPFASTSRAGGTTVSVFTIKKRDGRVVSFEASKIKRAIEKALRAIRADERAAGFLFGQVMDAVTQQFSGQTPGVEDIQDVVERTLIRNNFADTAKTYILYRQKHAEIRGVKKLLGVDDDLKLSVNAIKVMQRRYLAKDENGHVVETPAQMFQRVARSAAAVDKKYGKTDAGETEKEFYKAISNLEFLPNSPTLMNAGLKLGQLSACFVLPVDDSIQEIFGALKYMALIHQSGGGTGFEFSRLRPQGDIVKSTKGIASGPISFMRVFDVATEVVKQGGRRRGANMGILNVEHPDILEFITAKSREGFLTNFNLSVAATDRFMKDVKANRKYPLINPRTGEKEGELAARNVFDLIATMAWKTGDPGMIFLDEINRHNPTPQLGALECTNPCGEVPLLYFESCNLGSIDLARMVVPGGSRIDWKKLRKTVRTGVHFLDNIIDANKFPLPKIRRMTLANRKIGLGVMGFAEMLIKMGIPYNSRKAFAIAEEVMGFIVKEARQRSVELGKERGSFPRFRGSIWDGRTYPAMRNATVTTVAPTGSISVIAGCSSGIEPLFALSFLRNVMEGTRLLEVNPLFEEAAKRGGFYSETLMAEIARTGSIQNSAGIPREIKRLFVTAFDIKPEWHVRIQAAFQKYTDNAVSKTVNLPPDSSPDTVKKIYRMAHKLQCKGITVYRYGSKKEQVLTLGYAMRKERGEPEQGYVCADADYAGGCPTPFACNS